MSPEPRIEERSEQPYVGIELEARNEDEFRAAVDSAFPELFGWIGAAGLRPQGPPFMRYLEVSAEGDPRRFEVAAPLAAPAEVDGHDGGDGRVRAGALPPGRYAFLLHTGPYSSEEVEDLDAARGRLLRWIDGAEVELAGAPSEHGQAPEAAIERFIVGPMEDSDPSRWQTEIAILVR